MKDLRKTFCQRTTLKLSGLSCCPKDSNSSLAISHCFLVSQRLSAAAKLLQSCLTLCNPRDGSPPGSPIPGILQVRTLEWVAISFSKAWKWKVKVKSLNRVRLLATPWTAAYQAPLSMGFSRQEYWSGLWWPSPRPITPYLYKKLHSNTLYKSEQNSKKCSNKS